MGDPAAAQTFPAPEGLGDRGALLWVQMGAAGVADAGTRLLIEEACRTADRLERLDEILRGDVDAWAQLAHKEDGTIIVQLATALPEARQQQMTLQRLLAAIVVPAATGATTGTQSGGAQPSGDFLDRLAAKREDGGRPAPPRRART